MVAVFVLVAVVYLVVVVYLGVVVEYFVGAVDFLDVAVEQLEFAVALFADFQAECTVASHALVRFVVEEFVAGLQAVVVQFAELLGFYQFVVIASAGVAEFLVAASFAK